MICRPNRRRFIWKSVAASSEAAANRRFGFSRPLINIAYDAVLVNGITSSVRRTFQVVSIQHAARKAVEGYRTPRRCREVRPHQALRQVLNCASPLALPGFTESL